LGSKIASDEIIQKLEFKPKNFEKPNIFQAIMLSFKHLIDFLKAPSDIHKILLKYSLLEEHPVLPIAFNPFDVMYLVKDADLIHDILLKDPTAFQNRTSFPVVDYVYFKFIENTALLKDGKFNKQLEKNMGGITFTNDEVWKLNRNIGVKLMNDFNFLQFTVPHIIDSTFEMVKHLLKEKRILFHNYKEISI
jgi:hypothetical protein